jgi:hypothetical protein
MHHTSYGYEIKNGKAIIVEEEAEQVKKMFSYYLSGLSLADVATKTAIHKPHSSIGRMLRNRRYLGDDFYPPLIDITTFQLAEDERQRRAKLLGRIRDPMDKKEAKPIMSFRMPLPEQTYQDPFMQAEYAYSLIECEVTENAE